MAKRLDADAVRLAESPLAVEYGEVAKLAPKWCDWLGATHYEDGSRKGKCRVQIERVSNQFQIVLKDGDSGLCLTVRHECLSDALLSVEILLNSDECPWTLDPFPMGTRTKRKKK